MGALTAAEALRDGLAVLLPIAEPPAVDTTFDWESDVRDRTQDAGKEQLMEAAIAAASGGKDAVETVLAEHISALVNSVLDDDGASV